MTDYTAIIIKDLVEAQWPLPLAERFAHNFPALDRIFAPTVAHWCQHKAVLDITVCGCSLTHIMNIRQEHFWVCIRNMNAIYTDTTLSAQQRNTMMRHLCNKPVRE